jgi:hypothetical protein
MKHDEFVRAHEAWLHDYFSSKPELHGLGHHPSETKDGALIVRRSAGKSWHRWLHVISPMSVRFALSNFDAQREQWIEGMPDARHVGVIATRETVAPLRASDGR